MNPMLNMEYYLEYSHEIAFFSDLGMKSYFKVAVFSVICTKCIKLMRNENRVSLFTHFVSETTRRILIKFTLRGIDT
jgi:hypothetical protein